jgi:diadenosine tetraphosphate (Ap4A) HIT family hydrolase
MDDCVFCARIDRGDVELSNDHAAAFGDAYPLSEGHTLVVPLRHESTCSY